MQILIVSGNPVETAWLENTIGQCRLATVVSFDHPAAALDWCAGNDPDLVLVAHLMRATDGIEFIRRYRTLPRGQDVPLVLMHQPEAGFVRGDALRAGATDFLSQPVDFPELVARLVNLLALRHARLALGGRHWRAPAEPLVLPQLHSTALH